MGRPEDVAERLGELGVGDRVRRGQVDRALDVGGEEVHDRSDLVVDVDPALPLVARAHLAAESELEQRQLLLERAALGRQHDAGAQESDAGAGPRSAGAASCLPGVADVGEESGAGRRRLVERAWSGWRRSSRSPTPRAAPWVRWWPR